MVSFMSVEITATSRNVLVSLAQIKLDALASSWSGQYNSIAGHVTGVVGDYHSACNNYPICVSWSVYWNLLEGRLNYG